MGEAHIEARWAPAVGWLDAIEHEAGARPGGCPWRAYEQPLVQAALELHSVAVVGDGADLSTVLALDPPHVVWEAVAHYDRALSSARSAARKRERDRSRG